MNAGWALGAGLAAAIGSVGCVLVGYRLGDQGARRRIVAQSTPVRPGRCDARHGVDALCWLRAGHEGHHVAQNYDGKDHDLYWPPR